MSRVTTTALYVGKEVGGVPGPSSAKRAYSSPTLKLLGSVSELTQGGSGCVPDTVGLSEPGH